MGIGTIEDASGDFLFKKNPLVESLSLLGIFAYDSVKERALCNDLWRSWGYDEEDMKSFRLLDICHPEDTEKVARLLSAMRPDNHKVVTETFRIHTAEGRWVWVRHSSLKVASTGTTGDGMYVGHDTDLTDIKETEERLRVLTVQSELHAKEMETLYNAAAIISSSLDVAEAIRLILEQAKIVVPYDKASVQILKDGALELVGGNGFADITAAVGRRFPYPSEGSMSTLALDGRKVVICKDVAKDFPGFIRAEKERPTTSWMGIPLIYNGEVFGLLSFNHAEKDYFTERHARLASAFAVHVASALENARLHEKICKFAMEDALMGIGSRYLFDIQGKILFETARRKQTCLSLAIIDLDHFKVINDRYGHDVGDSVLKEIGRLCRQDYRSTDVIARFGGEEIVFIFPETDATTAVLISERLRALIKDTDFLVVGKSITISTGIASLIPDKNGSLADLLKFADSALYEAKKNGRNRIEVYQGV